CEGLTSGCVAGLQVTRGTRKSSKATECAELRFLRPLQSTRGTLRAQAPRGLLRAKWWDRGRAARGTDHGPASREAHRILAPSAPCLFRALRETFACGRH